MNNVEIIVEPNYLADQSNVMEDKYMFSYHITIVNRSNHIITLRTRHWEIVDAHGGVQTVSGVGVVGEQPTLYPDDDFEYSSSASLNTPWGSMSGHYEFEDNFGDRFIVPIPKFNLRAEFMVQ